MDVLELLVVMAIPAIGFLILWRALDRWGRKRDPMSSSHLDHFAPGAPGRDRSTYDD